MKPPLVHAVNEVENYMGICDAHRAAEIRDGCSKSGISPMWRKRHPLTQSWRGYSHYQPSDRVAAPVTTTFSGLNESCSPWVIFIRHPSRFGCVNEKNEYRAAEIGGQAVRVSVSSVCFHSRIRQSRRCDTIPITSQLSLRDSLAIAAIYPIISTESMFVFHRLSPHKMCNLEGNWTGVFAVGKEPTEAKIESRESVASYSSSHIKVISF